ncbi:T9SS type A sorting domain-containing protein [Chryseobacterium sp. OSA05B]|uniref:T9SS type A sorting domain-containing protein n=1 Tax=Chryseobacterium sp. OSA05B TaxID=2862650 RepID=UPI001CBED11D|nr:T9SS type A sorting domain-containing protein [Chryseobacterium sp. OSA05B]
MYFLAIYLLLGCLVFDAQAPCSDFNASSNPAGNWAPSPYPNGNVTVNFGSANALDGSQYLILGDLSFGSWYQNATDYKDLGKRFLGQCLYFDFYLKNDSGYGQPYHPFITLSDGVRSASFVASVTVTPGSGWVRVKAPIQLSSGGVLPSNSEGAWILNDPTSTAADFDNIILYSRILSITPDITTTQNEIMFFDNICVKPCDGCSADFNVTMSYSTIGTTATASLTLINPILFSTPGNPGPTYTIDWGDGTSSAYIYPTVSHSYAVAGNYTICVTESRGKFSTCKRCFTFCYKPSPVATRDESTTTMTKSPFTEVRAVAKAELQSGDHKGFSLVPNPANNYVELQTTFTGREAVLVRLIDISGKIVLEKSEVLENGNQSIKLNIEKMNQGNYIVELQSKDKISSQKLIISQ